MLGGRSCCLLLRVVLRLLTDCNSSYLCLITSLDRRWWLAVSYLMADVDVCRRGLSRPRLRESLSVTRSCKGMMTFLAAFHRQACTTMPWIPGLASSLDSHLSASEAQLRHFSVEQWLCRLVSSPLLSSRRRHRRTGMPMIGSARSRCAGYRVMLIMLVRRKSTVRS